MSDHIAEFNAAELVLRPGQVILWWERRRVLYNCVLLPIGIAAILVWDFVMLPAGIQSEAPRGVLTRAILFGFAGNLFYTLGWLAELYERANNAVAARKHGIRNFWIVVVLGGMAAAAPAWYAWLLMARSPHYLLHCIDLFPHSLFNW